METMELLNNIVEFNLC